MFLERLYSLVSIYRLFLSNFISKITERILINQPVFDARWYNLKLISLWWQEIVKELMKMLVIFVLWTWDFILIIVHKWCKAIIYKFIVRIVHEIFNIVNMFEWIFSKIHEIFDTRKNLLVIDACAASLKLFMEKCINKIPLLIQSQIFY